MPLPLSCTSIKSKPLFLNRTSNRGYRLRQLQERSLIDRICTKVTYRWMWRRHQCYSRPIPSQLNKDQLWLGRIEFDGPKNSTQEIRHRFSNCEMNCKRTERASMALMVAMFIPWRSWRWFPTRNPRALPLYAMPRSLSILCCCATNYTFRFYGGPNAVI